MQTDNDPSAGALTFDQFVAARWHPLVRTAHLLSGDPEAGADLLQDVLAKAYVQWDRISGADSPEAYVRTMLTNAFIDGRRREQRRRDATSRLRHWLVGPAGPISADPSERLALWDQLATLSPQQRAVIVLRYYEDLSERQIAATLGISAGSVKSYAHTALRKLRSQAEAAPQDSEGAERT